MKSVETIHIYAYRHPNFYNTFFKVQVMISTLSISILNGEG